MLQIPLLAIIELAISHQFYESILTDTAAYSTSNRSAYYMLTKVLVCTRMECNYELNYDARMDIYLLA